VLTSAPTTLRNSVTLTTANGFVSTDTATVIANPYQVWLPVVIRE
jgi:hypothetical protein